MAWQGSVADRRVHLLARQVLAARCCQEVGCSPVASDEAVEELDVVVIGGGFAGVGAAYRLKQDCPKFRFAVLEKRDRTGGTWHLYRFPGIRSDIEMFSYAFEWQPWRDPDHLFGTGARMLEYLDEVVAAHGLAPHIRTGVAVHSVSFSSSERRWRVRTSAGSISCKFLFVGMGYYDYEVPNSPELPGKEHFEGEVIHPQHWPASLDVTGKRVVILGSGATAVTLAPELAEKAASVTILQRTPTWVQSRSSQEYWLPRQLRKLSPESADRLSSLLYPLNDTYHFFHAKVLPSFARRYFVNQTRSYLGAAFKDYAMPEYPPWEQRVCTTKDGEFLTLIRDGKVRVVTDRVQALSATAVICERGEELPADLLVTATGFNLQRQFPMNDVVLDVDGRPYNSRETMMYKSVMLSDVPNLFTTSGYFHAAYTKRVDNTWTFACRVMNLMEETGRSLCVAPRDPSVPEFDPEQMPSSGYIQRSLQSGSMVKQAELGSKWQTVPDPWLEGRAFRKAAIEDGVLSLL